MAATKKLKKSIKPKKLVKTKKAKMSATKGNTLNNLLKSMKKAVGITSKTSSPKKLPPLEKVSNAFNKSQLISTLAERSDVNKKQVAFLLNELFNIIGLHIKKGGPEKFVFPGAFKIVVKKIAAKKARNGINPFTGQPTVFKAKPASRKVKIIPLKSLKDLAI